MTQQDGLGGNAVRAMHVEESGDIWFTHENGVTRYRPPEPTPPPVSIHTVVADRRYTGISELSLSTPVGLVSFEYTARSFKTPPGKIVYRYRLAGHDEGWKTTRRHQVEYEDLPRGDYTFEVQAVDRDLVYSEAPATLALTVHLPYERIGLLTALGIAVLLIAWQTGRVVIRDRRLQVSNKALSDAMKELFDTNRVLETAKGAAEAANVAKSRFLASMSHEIRTPMNAILGYAQILKRDSRLIPDHRSSIETIHRSGDHLLKLINDVLDISKIEAGRLELQPADFDLQAILNDLSVMFQLRCEQKRLVWQVDMPEADRIPVHGDEAKLSQVLINLLGNAVKFTDRGSVALKVGTLPENQYRFEVIDTGPGISEEDREEIFEAFTQADAGMKSGGTGLGLSISQRLIELLGGKLELDSTVGQGSRFYFTVPLPPAKAEVLAPAEDQWANVVRLADGHAVTALVADDVVENRDVLSHLLTDIGVEVILAENGKEAVDQVKANPPDIVFMDIHMPEMDGPEAARRIWDELGKDALKVVAVSASTLEHEAREYRELGFDDFVPKPFRAEQVYACLAKHLGVEFEVAEPVAVAEAPALNLEGISLPEDLFRRLEQAAEFSNVTELEQTLEEVGNISPEASRLAAHLHSLSQDFKMDEILDVLREINHG